MGLLDSVSNVVDHYVRPVIEKVEDVLGIEHEAPPPAPEAPPQSFPRAPVPCPPGAGPTPPAARLSAASGSAAGAIGSPNFEFDRFLDKHDRPAVERAVREVLGLRDNQPLPGPVSVQFCVACRPGMGEIQTVSVTDVGFRLPPNVTRDQLEAAVRRAIQCNPVPPYAIPPSSLADASTRQSMTVGGRPTADPALVS
ncbi:MAG TPA: hypothetical protein VFX30_12770 [bacterium]|nr:hypothetical protein [bacterium]